MSEPTCHIPVMLAEVLEWLAPAPGKLLVDGTLGGGGHTAALAERVVPGGRVWALDLDEVAVERCEPLREALPIELAIGSYTKIPELLKSCEVYRQIALSQLSEEELAI